jgi:hypothetical protein
MAHAVQGFLLDLTGEIHPKCDKGKTGVWFDKTSDKWPQQVEVGLELVTEAGKISWGHRWGHHDCGWQIFSTIASS